MGAMDAATRLPGPDQRPRAAQQIVQAAPSCLPGARLGSLPAQRSAGSATHEDRRGSHGSTNARPRTPRIPFALADHEAARVGGCHGQPSPLPIPGGTRLPLPPRSPATNGPTPAPTTAVAADVRRVPPRPRAPEPRPSRPSPDRSASTQTTPLLTGHVPSGACANVDARDHRIARRLSWRSTLPARSPRQRGSAFRRRPPPPTQAQHLALQ